MAHAHWVTGGELGKGRGEPQWTVHCPQRGQQHNAGDGPGLKIRGQEVVPGPQSSQQEKQRPGQPRAGRGKAEGRGQAGRSRSVETLSTSLTAFLCEVPALPYLMEASEPSMPVRKP